MEMQQIFGHRLEQLLSEKGISQGEFAEAVNCSRQSINFYILGKRNPDIALAGKMAEYLGVSCDYLVGLSNIREDKNSNLTADQLGLTDDTMKFFTGLQLLATGNTDHIKKDYEAIGFDYEKEIVPYNMAQGKATLKLLNDLISHERFGILLQYIKRYKDIANGEDTMALLQDFMVQLESPITGKIYGGKEENIEMMKEFCLHIVSKYFDEIVKDIVLD
ncbi:MAG: helix-turn-helix transcriptional regulator [Clostridia bacterium]|nr:helix-turn-helix transcriptional regulator [Clostridia bacterium]